MSIVDRILASLPEDKVKHFLFGAVLSVAGLAVWSATGHAGPGATLLSTFATALAFGLAKEALDAWDNWQARKAGQEPVHSVDPLDVLATAAGGLYVGGMLALAQIAARHFYG